MSVSTPKAENLGLSRVAPYQFELEKMREEYHNGPADRHTVSALEVWAYIESKKDYDATMEQEAKLHPHWREPVSNIGRVSTPQVGSAVPYKNVLETAMKAFRRSVAGDDSED